MVPQQTKDIVNGPGIFELSTRLFEGDNREQRPVTFSINTAQEVRQVSVKLNSASREDGSGKNWNLEGYSLTDDQRVCIFYNLRTRTGKMNAVS